MARGVIFGWLGRLGGGDALSPDMDAFESISASSTEALNSAADAFCAGLAICASEEGGCDAMLTM